MSDDYRFATQGELIKLAYDAFGVLPRKHADRTELDETQKKTIQKQLARLAKEEGRLIPNFEETIQTLGKILAKYFTSPLIMAAVHDTLADLLEAYSALVREEGTFLDKQETLRYFISTSALPLVIVSLNKSLLSYSLLGFGETVPKSEFWFLPTVASDGRIEWPLEKVMRWAYQICNTTQTQFHYPGKNTESENYQLQQNLESAAKWTRGVSLPALPVLFHNFNQSFEAMAGCGCKVPKQLQTNILTALTVARVVSYIGRELERIYDVHYLEELSNQFRDYASWIADDLNEFKAELVPILQQIESPEKSFVTWQSACINYWTFFNMKIASVGERMQRFQNEQPSQSIRKDEVESLRRKYGRFAVNIFEDVSRRQMQFTPPERFAEMLYRGFDLKNDSSTQLKQVEEYAVQLADYRLDKQLRWMEHWLRAVFYYRREEYKASMKYFHKAFNNAKYRAGKSQYKLVNQYVEVAAKNDDRRNFKKGVEWAQYLGIEIRWLRKDEPTEEKLDYVFFMMKIAQYDHQM